MLVLSRFLNKVTVGPSCWNWSGAKIPDGYGHLNVGGRRVGAHRIAWELGNGGAIPDGLLVRHKCDNPSCVRPSHLELGTMRENAADSVERGRNPMTRKTHCPRGHAYSGTNVYVSFRRDRQCRTCKREYQRGWRERRRVGL